MERRRICNSRDGLDTGSVHATIQRHGHMEVLLEERPEKPTLLACVVIWSLLPDVGVNGFRQLCQTNVRKTSQTNPEH